MLAGQLAFTQTIVEPFVTANKVQLDSTATDSVYGSFWLDGTEFKIYSTSGWTVVGSGSGSGTVTSVDLSAPTGLTVSGNPITTSGTIALAFTSGYSIPLDSSQLTWDTAYNDRIESLEFTGTTTKTLTLTQGDAGTVSNTFTDIGFANPLTTQGDIIVQGAGGTTRLGVGTAGQYLSTDGTDITWSPATWTRSGNYVYVTTDSVGIGTTSPSEMLHVDGNISLSGSDDTLKVYRVIQEENGINILKPPQAFGWFADSNILIDLTQNTWSQITNASDSLIRVFEEVDVVFDGDTLVPPAIAAHYEITAIFTFRGETSNSFAVRIMTNEREIATINFSFSSNTENKPVPINGCWDAVGGGADRLWFEVINTTDSDDIRIKSGNVRIKYSYGIY